MTLPAGALDQHTAILGKTGAGKSYTVRGIIERLLREGNRACIVDYTGVWWGLRLNKAGDGPSEFNAVIFGGEHADIPLTEGSGPIVARVVAEGTQPVIIDVDGISVGAQQRFVTAFLEELYKLNRHRLYLVIEEADEFAPQTGAPGAERMIGATCRIFQRGRVKGFRAIAVTQRPANIHKRVLTQCNTLITMRLTAPQDHKAVADWIKGHGDADKGEKVIASLARLQRGDGWVWAPEQDYLELKRFPGITTYDSMRPPLENETIPEPKPIDLAALKQQFAEAVNDVEQNDPKKLKAEIQRLEAIVSKGGTEQDARDAYDRGVNEGYLQGRREIAALVSERALTARSDVSRALKALELADSALNSITTPPPNVVTVQVRDKDVAELLNAAEETRRQAGIPEIRLPPEEWRDRFMRVPDPDGGPHIKPSEADAKRKRAEPANGLDGAAVKLLEAFKRYPVGGLTWEEACIVAGLVPGNGYFYGGKKRLIEGLHVHETGGGGRFIPQEPEGAHPNPVTRAEILQTWRKVRAPGGMMLEILLRTGRMKTETLAAEISLKPGNGYWYGGLKALKDANLVTVDGGWIRLTEFVNEARR